METCCKGSSKRCFCLPYDDTYMITAQILSIVAFLISWIWWVSFTISVAALVLHQIIWCCRQSRMGLITAHIVSVVAALMCIFAGIFLLIFRKSAWWCAPFTLQSYDDDDDDDYTFFFDDDWSDDVDIFIIDDDWSYDVCYEKAYAAVAFVDAGLWLGAALFTISFVTSGRYAKWEATYGRQNAAAEEAPAVVEMANVEAAEPTEDDDADALATAMPVKESAPTEYVPPEVVEPAVVEPAVVEPAVVEPAAAEPAVVPVVPEKVDNV